MTTQLSSLAVRPDLDPSKFVQGAKQLDAAAASAGKAVAGIGVASDAVNHKISQAGDVVGRLSRQYVDGYASAQRFQSALNSLSREMEKGNLTINQAQPILDGIYRKYSLMGDAAQFAAKGQMELATAIMAANARIEAQRRITPANNNARLSSGQLQNFGYQANDIITMALLGAPLSQIAVSQGGQVLQGLQMNEGGVAGSLKAIKGSAVEAGAAVAGFLGPVGLAAAGVTALGVGTYALVRYFHDTSAEAKEFQTWLDKIGSSANTAADFLERVSKATQGLTAVDLNKLTRQGTAFIKEQRSQLENPLAIASGFQGNIADPAFVQTYNLIDKIIGKLRSDNGFRDIDDLHSSLDRVIATRPDLQRFTEQWEKLGEAILKAKQANEQNARQAELAMHGMGAYQPRDGAAMQTYLNRNADTLFQLQQQRAVDLSTIGARSPDHLRRAADARERARPVDPNESAEVRNYRIATAGAVAYAQAMHQLQQAREERKRSLDATLASQRLDLDLIGKTGGQVAAMRMEFQLTQQLREEAARNNIPVDQRELDLIRQKAAAYGQMAEQIGRARLHDDLGFELRQAGRSPKDQSIASRLRSAGLPENLNSADAAAIRFTDHIKEMANAWKGVQTEGMDAIDKIEDSLLNGGKDIKETFLGIGKTFLKSIVDLDLVNPLKNKLYGTQLPTLHDVGGIGGFFKALFGGKQDLPSKIPGLSTTALSSMQVTAASVFINGSPIGAPGGIPGLPNGIPGLPGQNTPASASHLLSQLGSPLGTPANSNVMPIGLYGQAIKSIESGSFAGNYNALGPLTKNGDRAYGAYQIMGDNIGPWSKQALGYALTPDQFLGNKAAQDAIFSKIFGGYVNKFGPAGAAQAWFGGPGSVGKGGMGADILGTTGNSYVAKFSDALTKATSGLGSFDTGISKVGQSLLGNILPGSSGGGLFDMLKGGSPIDGSNPGGSITSLLKMLSGGNNGPASLPGLPSLPGAFPAAPSLPMGGGLLNGVMSIFKVFGSLFGLGGLGGLFGPSLSPLASLSVLLGHGGLYDSGGYTGPGGVKQPAGIVHKGEVVWSQADVARVGGVGMAESLRRGMVTRPMHMPVQPQQSGLSKGDLDTLVSAIKSQKTSFKNINVNDPSVVGQYLNTDEGEQIVMNIVNRNKAA